eukprot:Rhum_TRINITY_DN7918_c1_g1::Rhum_TRINITY_DN7918_c1_g1_i1::g.25062::m.25062
MPGKKRVAEKKTAAAAEPKAKKARVEKKAAPVPKEPTAEEIAAAQAEAEKMAAEMGVSLEDLMYQEEAEEGEEEEEMGLPQFGENPWYIIMGGFGQLTEDGENKAMLKKLVADGKKGKLPEPVCQLLEDWHWKALIIAHFYSELCEGGFAQYLLSVRCDDYPLFVTLALLEEFGATQHAELLRKTHAILEALPAQEANEFIESDLEKKNNKTRDTLNKHAEAALEAKLLQPLEKIVQETCDDVASKFEALQAEQEKEGAAEGGCCAKKSSCCK